MDLYWLKYCFDWVQAYLAYPIQQKSILQRSKNLFPFDRSVNILVNCEVVWIFELYIIWIFFITHKRIYQCWLCFFFVNFLLQASFKMVNNSSSSSLPKSATKQRKSGSKSKSKSVQSTLWPTRGLQLQWNQNVKCN